MSGKKKQASLDIFSEVANMELECELAFAATCYWCRSCWEGKWADDVYEGWKKQIFDASSGAQRERSAASSGMRACSGQIGTRLVLVKLRSIVGCSERH